MIRVLITGGCGFIGANLTEYLLNNTDWHINILDNLSNGNLKDLENLKEFKTRVSFFKGDIIESKDISSAIKDCKYVINLAAQTGVIDSIQNPTFDERVNIYGIINLLKMSVDHKVEKFIQASSAAVLGKQKMPINEEMCPKPISPYGVSKLASESYCRAFSYSYNIKTVILRFSNVYGPKSYNKGSVIPKFIRNMLSSDPLEVYGNGNQTRDFIYVKDICYGIYLSLIKDLNNFELIQLGTGAETSINSLIDNLKDITKEFNLIIPEVKYSKSRVGEILHSYCDISKAEKILNFLVKGDLKQGLEETFKWFLENYKK